MRPPPEVFGQPFVQLHGDPVGGDHRQSQADIRQLATEPERAQPKTGTVPAAKELERYGGSIIEGTRSGDNDPDVVQIVFLADPDGNRIELMRLARGQAW